MGIREHIERRQANEKIVPLIERRGGTEQRAIPEWVKRAQERRLPNVDRTGSVAA